MTPLAILIVEDEGIVAEDLRQSLLDMGYDAFAIAASAEEALRIASVRRPDLVLMDIRIKGARDGIDAAVELRERHAVPIIFLTAHADGATLERAKRAEPLGFLVKPIKLAELRGAVEVAVHKHALERKLRDSEQWFVATLRSITDAVIALDLSGVVTFLNPPAEAMLGVTAGTAVGRPFQLPVAYLQRGAALVELAAQDRPSTRALGGETVRDVECFMPTTATWHSVNASPVRDNDGRLRGAVVVARDVTELHRVRDQLEHDAVRDELTGLLNRRGFREQAEAALRLAVRGQRLLSLLYLDLDGMKGINDQHGHAAGDEALQEIANMLRLICRASDLVARIGGDEFVVLAVDYEGDDDVLALRTRLDLLLAKSNDRRKGSGFQLAVSIGYTTYDPRQGPRTLDELLADADQRMYVTKQQRARQKT